jgi:hypothetical protein
MDKRNERDRRTVSKKCAVFRKHELFPKSSYHGNCPGVATIWQETDGGVAANVRVKRPAPRAASGKNWELDLIWDAPVSSFEVVSNGVSEQTSGQAFKVRFWSFHHFEDRLSVGCC